MYRTGTSVLYIRVGTGTSIPFDILLFDDFIITFKRKSLYGEINKCKADCEEVTSEYIKLALKQEETIKLVSRGKVKIQAKFYKHDTQEIITTTWCEIPVEEVLNGTEYK